MACVMPRFCGTKKPQVDLIKEIGSDIPWINAQGCLIGMLILHVDVMLAIGPKDNDEFKKASKSLRIDFNFAKWDELSPSQPLKYCGGTTLTINAGIEVCYKEHVKKICPMNIGKIERIKIQSQLRSSAQPEG